MIAVRKDGGQDAFKPFEILFVGIDPGLCRPVFDAMKKPAVAVTTVDDSRLLAKVLRKTTPELVLLDFGSPGIDGVGLCKRLKASAETADIPVVFLLANDELDKRALAFQAGAADYLIKPLLAEEVTAKLGLYIKRRTVWRQSDSAGSQPEKLPMASAASHEAFRQGLAERRNGAMNHVFDRLHDAVYLVDSRYAIRYANKSASRSLGYSGDELLGMRVWDIDPHLDAKKICVAGGESASQEFFHFETYHRAKDGHVFPVEISSAQVTYEGQSMWLCVVLDISERRRVEQERQSHRHYFECMDRVNRAIQGAGDLEAMLGDVLDEVLAIFDCDRTYLVNPCDPGADSWCVPMERSKQGFPGAYALTLKILMDEEGAYSFRRILDGDGPATFGPGNQHPVPESVAEQFGIRAFMAMAIYPKADKPWQFGIHQCSKLSVWTPAEIELFQAIGRRLADGLSSLLAYRALQASESDYRMLVENVPVSIARYDAQGRITHLNSPLEKLLRVTTAEVKGKRPTECFPELYYQEYEQRLLEVAANGETAEFEWEGAGSEGREVGVITIMAERDKRGAITGLLAIGQSFSLQRRIEAALKRSEALYGSVVSAMMEGVIVLSRDGHILTVNPAAEAMLGLPSGAAPDKYALDVALEAVTLEGQPFPIERHPAVLSLASGQAQFGVEMGICRDDGGVLWISVNARPLFAEGEDKPYAVVSTLHDITEGKRTEAERLKSIAVLKQNEALLTERLTLERRFSRMANHVPGFLYTFKMGANGQGKFVYVSSGVADIYGLQPDEVMGDASALHDMSYPADRIGLDAAIAQAVCDATSFHYEYRICHPSKGVLWLEAKAMPTVKDDGNVVFHGFVQDISERKRIEQTLTFIARIGWQESREAFLVSLSGFLGQMLEVDYVLIDKLTADAAFAETIVVYRKGEILPNIRYPLAGTPCDSVMDGVLCCYPEGVRQLFPEDTLLQDMRVESYAGLPLRDSAGNTLGLIAVMDGKAMTDSNRVVSILQLVAIRVAAELERDRFERVLAESRQFLYSVINTIAEPVFVKNRRHRWILVNAAFCKLIGQTEEALLGKSDYDFFPQHEADEYWARDEGVFRSGEEAVNEDNFTDAHGATRTIVTKKTCYIDANGEGVLVGIMLDITERKQMEAMIRKREEEFRTLAENLPDVVVRYDKSFRRIYINKVYNQMLEPLGIDLLGRTPLELWKATEPDADQFTRMLQKVIETGCAETALIQADTGAGQNIHWTMKLVPEFDQDGSVCSVLTCAADITVLKEYQREIEDSRSLLRALASRNEKLREDERRRIARELHDDLGQRLTALKLDLSRLTLRFGRNDPALNQQVQEMEVDIGTTIQIVRDVATRLRPPALEMGIVSALEWLVQEFRKRTNVSCRLRLAEPYIGIDDSLATVLFRIVQESLTNIMRYAMASEVEIVLSCDGEYYCLEVSDDGAGFNAEYKRKVGSFGLIGIEERAQSLGGEMRIDTAPDQGTKLTVRIPVFHALGEKYDQSVNGR